MTAVKESLTPDRDLDEAENAVRVLIRYIGEDPDRPGLVDTPHRFVKALMEKTCGYRGETPEQILSKSFPTADTDSKTVYDGMVVQKNIPIASMCFPGKQYVSTSKGRKTICTVRVGDELWSLKNGVPVLTKVEKITSRKAPSIATVTLPNGKKLRATPDHPVMTPTGWEEIGRLKAGDKIEWINPQWLCAVNHPFNVGRDLGFVLGAVASDGSIQDDRRVCLEVCSKEFAELYAKAVKGAFDLDCAVQPIWKPSGFLGRNIRQYRVRFVSGQLARRLLKCLKLPFGLGSRSKTFKFHLPDIIKTDVAIAGGFLEGYWWGDGNRDHADIGDWLCTGNRDFAVELGAFLDAYIDVCSTTKYSTAYRVRYADDWASDRKGRRLRKIGGKVSYDWFMRHGFRKEVHELDIGESVFVPIKSVVIEETPIKVWSIQCSADQPSFLACGVHVHNCEHHAESIAGVAHVAYIPGKKVAGLSKLIRLVDCFARRLQIQERLTAQIADALMEHLKCYGAACVIEASHNCISCRGVQKQGTTTRTACLRGAFMTNDAVRTELMFHLGGAC